jgi:uncharacterized protein YecE (DUF72 family)
VYWIGTSGWSYKHWKGRFYPESLSAGEWLSYYSEHLCSVEINATFYRLQRPETFARWVAAVPTEFRFAFKASQYLTHRRRLRESSEGLRRLLDSTVPLGERRGPMLLQLPPRFPASGDRLASFLDACPLELEVAVEFRDPAWFTTEIEQVLRRHGAALVWSDYPGAESPQWDTARFVYIRRHGGSGRFFGRYGRQRLQALATTMEAAGKTTYCYFNNDAEGAAVADALELAELAELAGR